MIPNTDPFDRPSVHKSTMSNKTIKIAVIPGDGIGTEVMVGRRIPHIFLCKTPS